MDKEKLLKKIHKGLIVSCQALPDEPMFTESGGIMPLFAKAASQAGAVGIRANSVRDIREIKNEVDLPVIGLIKRIYPNSETFITPSMREVDELVNVGCDIIAFEFTTHSREDGNSPSNFHNKIKEKYPTQLTMADCATLNDALLAHNAGVDFIGTTMSGYTEDSITDQQPNYNLVRAIVAKCSTPVIAEGRIHYPNQATEMLKSGAYCVVVGGAITRPKEIAERFINAIKENI